MKKFLTITSLLLLLLLAACGSKEGSSGDKDKAANKESELSEEKLVVGVTAGPHEQIVEKVKEVAEADGLEVELKVFNDYVMPNMALAEEEIDINVYQHKPYLEQFKKDRGLDLTEVTEVVNFPMGLYSSKVKDLSEIKDGAKIGLPNDPTNGARALILFEQAGLVKLKEGAGVTATLKDIEENKQNLEFIELEAAQIPRQLEELDAAAINTNFAVEHGFTPAKDAIAIEPKDSPWANVIAVRTGNEDDAAVKKFVEYYKSEEVKQFIEETFAGSVIAAW
ncbi:metal ABC transporter substrate-binding protein [Bacillus canaveralius]|uniref:Lipoprotein n=1 Tax=Bacillus canaveralius TaxID=1403243 RepID=A0A2N5GM21_9BACI|nr:MetQ/NlpA family ABC transporter substrate-binding protein [Bacillus canaveralius]PLR82864.1 metal ABC transporter substrate-binding protein [Bacillus canaveralius]PLR97131.1 metal ABC transporter substrate-binding protein [Bacillus canaveralius]